MANKKDQKKLSLNPPAPSNTNDIEKFINSAENHTKTSQQKKDILPWEVDAISINQMKSLRLGIHEEYLLKLKHLSEKTDIPQQKIVRAVLYPAIDDYIKQLTEEGFIKL